ncbi:MAG: hypothetical protein JW969_15700 [Spirochaetales bacterium]|nr:hypothetical protein [Spirochaetales bacterium]
MGSDGIILTSEDGISWSSSNPTSYTLEAVDSHGGINIAVGQNGLIMYKDDNP